MDGIILKEITVNEGNVNYKFEARGILKKYFTTDTMFIEYDRNISDVPKSILAVPFVASILPLMWLTNTVMWIEELDRTFYDSVSRIHGAYQRLYYHYPLKGNLVPARLVENSFVPKRESLLLFSGGIDANTTYIRIEDTNPILFNIQGWYHQLCDIDKAADAEVRDVHAFADREEREVHFAKSNFAVLVRNDTFSKIQKKLKDSWWHGFQHSMSFISLAIPLAYQEKVKNIYIASSVPMGEYVMCASHVTTDSEFRYATVGGCIHDGSELTRQDKVHTIVNYANRRGTQYPLKVCSFNDINCCKCDKCFRSILGITAEGGNVKDYGFDNFDGTLYHHFSKLMDEEIVKFNIQGESSLHWPAIKKRMKENYDIIQDRDFVDWFMSYDFIQKKKKAVIQYRIKNCFKILHRKIFGE